MSDLRRFRRTAQRRDTSTWRLLGQKQMNIEGEARYIIQRAQKREGRIVALNPLIFFSTPAGDAWVLDQDDHFALCLAQDGEEQPYTITETSTRFAIQWNAHYRIEGDVFVVIDRSGCERRVLGYPVAEIEARSN